MPTTDPNLYLLPVDGSESAGRAAAHCARLAKALGGRVLVLNVQPRVEDWQTHGIGHESAVAHLRGIAAQALAAAETVLREAGVAHESLVEFGNPSETIARVAESRGCGAVVMGTRGQSELKSLVMGGVGMKVLHLVPVPITFVH